MTSLPTLYTCEAGYWYSKCNLTWQGWLIVGIALAIIITVISLDKEKTK